MYLVLCRSLTSFFYFIIRTHFLCSPVYTSPKARRNLVGIARWSSQRVYTRPPRQASLAPLTSRSWFVSSALLLSAFRSHGTFLCLCSSEMWRQLTDYEKTCWADGRSLWFTLSLACGLSSSAGLIRSLTKEGGWDLAKFVVLEPDFGSWPAHNNIACAPAVLGWYWYN